MTTVPEDHVSVIVRGAEALREEGRAQGRAEAAHEFSGEAALRLTMSLLAAVVSEAAAQLGRVAPDAAGYLTMCADEFREYANPPTVVSISPATDAASVSADEQIVIGFSTPLDEDTATAENIYVAAASGGPHLAAELVYDVSSQSVTLIPANPLSPGVTYRITVADAVRSRLGQSMATGYTSEFATAE